MLSVIADEDQVGEAGGSVTGRRMENSIAVGRAACGRSQLFYAMKVSFYQGIIGNTGIAVCRRGGWLVGWLAGCFLVSHCSPLVTETV